jgi:hypothetical protein
MRRVAIRELTPRAKAGNIAVGATVGALAIAIPALTKGEPGHLAVGALLGVFAMAVIMLAAHLNRTTTTTRRRSLPGWSGGFGFVAVTAAVILLNAGYADGITVLGFVGGIGLAYAFVLGVLPRRLWADPSGQGAL